MQVMEGQQCSGQPSTAGRTFYIRVAGFECQGKDNKDQRQNKEQNMNVHS